MKHDHVPGVFAHIDIDGFRLEEFEDDEEVDNEKLSTTRYVEAVAGSRFTVGLTFSPEFLYTHNDVHCAMYLDGHNVANLIRRSRDGGHKTLLFDGRTEVTPTGSYLRKFQFSELTTHDGSVKAGLTEKLKELGTITIRLVRCAVGGTKRAHVSDALNSLGGESIPEKGLKGRAISTQATLGAPQKIKELQYVDVSYPYGNLPFAKFTFKYRSHKDLQVEGIISRSPSPVPLEDRDPATLDADELRELLERRNEELEQMSKIKKEKREQSTTIVDDEDDDDEVTITERRPKRHRTSQDSGVDVVDLTDD